MAYSLDTNVVLWALISPKRLGPTTMQVTKLEKCFISVVSVWEIIIKISIGKLHLPLPPREVISLLEAIELPITLKHVNQVEVVQLPRKDPFDHMLVAQAEYEHLTLTTEDMTLLASPYKVTAARL